jgi:hypothetical protein
MRGQRRWLGLLVAVVAVVGGATPAAAKEAPPPAPSVCTPACQPGQTCVSGTCMIPAPPPPPAPAPPPPPPVSAPPPGYPSYPGYAPPPPYAPPPSYAPHYPPPPPRAYEYSPLPRPPRQRRLLAMAAIGAHSYQNETASMYFPGLRIGGLIGARINDALSLNWELTLDISNVDEPPTAAAYPSSNSELAFDVAISPLVHLPFGIAEFVLGPKLGFFWAHTDDDYPNYGSRTGTGLVGGINAGIFTQLGSVTSIGMLTSFEFRKIEHACDPSADSIALCDLARDTAAKVVSLSAAALFR